MTLAQNFQRTFEVMVGGLISGSDVRQFLADEADSNVRQLIDSGQVAPLFRRFVNGVENAPGASVRLDGSGSIAYLFSSIAEAAGFALDFARNHSPVDSGVYRDSWFFLVDGRPWTGDLFGLPLGAEVVLTNHQPYHRKIDVGGMRMSVAPQIVEATRQAVMAKFPGVDAQRIFITIPGGYVLKGKAFRSGLSYNKRRKRFVQIHPRKATNRKDARRGELMTYPSLVLQEIV